MRSSFIPGKIDKEKRSVQITGWAIIVGVLMAWLAIGTVCIIYVAGQTFLAR